MVKRILIGLGGTRFVQLRLWPNISLSIVCFEKKKDEAEQLLDDASAYCRAHGFDPEVEFVLDPPKDSLFYHARKRNADLIVMGNGIRSVLFRRLLGNAMLHAIQSADRPLFLSQ